MYRNLELREREPRTTKKPASQPRTWFLLVCLGFGLVFVIIVSLLAGFLHNRSSSGFDPTCPNATEEKILETRNLQLTEERDQLKQALQKIENLMSEGWVYFRGSWYLGSTTAQNWTESRKFCQERGANLIIINSTEEQEFAHLTFKEMAWIGLSDREHEGNWKWVDGSALTTSFWSPGEPSNHFGVEDCAFLSPRRNSLHSWNDIVCTDLVKCICEKLHL